MGPIPSLGFTFVQNGVDEIVCEHCHQRIVLDKGRRLAFWGMNGAPLHRDCADDYIRTQGWVPAIMPGINIYARIDPSDQG